MAGRAHAGRQMALSTPGRARTQSILLRRAGIFSCWRTQMHSAGEGLVAARGSSHRELLGALDATVLEVGQLRERILLRVRRDRALGTTLGKRHNILRAKRPS